MKIQTKIGQILLIAVIGLIGVMSANAQEHMNSFQIVSNVLANGESIKQGQGLRSPNGQYATVLQKDGNLCLYKIDPKAKYGNQFIKCTMTVGSEDKKGAVLKMQEDGNLVLYNSKGGPVWSTDTYRGDVNKKGWRVIMDDVGNLVLVNKAEQVVYHFQKGRAY